MPLEIEPWRTFAHPDLSGTNGKTVIAAIKNLAEGKADKTSQIVAMNFIVEVLADCYGDPFRPDNIGGQRETDYACGRAYVGRELRRIVVQPYTVLSPDS